MRRDWDLVRNPPGWVSHGKYLFRRGTSMFRHGKYLFRRGTSMFRHGRYLFRHGTSIFRHGKYLFRDGPGIWSPEDTFSATELIFSATELTFSMTENTFSVTELISSMAEFLSSRAGKPRPQPSQTAFRTENECFKAQARTSAPEVTFSSDLLFRLDAPEEVPSSRRRF